MSLIAVIDTNVLVAGLLSRDADSPVVRVTDALFAARFPYAVSGPLLAEYREVLLRPALRRLHGLKVGDVDALLTELVQHAIVIEPPLSPEVAPDPGDQMLWDLLGWRTEVLLVSGDKRLVTAGAGRVLSPRDFVETHV